MYVYAADLPASFLADPPGSAEDTLARPTQEALGIFATATMTEAVKGADRVWLVIFDQEIHEMRGSPHSLSWLEARCRQVDQIRFGDLRIALFERRTA
jgi:hypothetical protein